jgi:hypothetical protein
MNRNRNASKQRYTVEQLVEAAYKQARHVSNNRQVTALVASKLLEAWLVHSDRPDLVQRLQSPAS